MANANIYRSKVTGLSYSNYAEVANTIEVSDVLLLELQSNNAHDNEAVAVVSGGQQIGWLDASTSEARAAKSVIAALLRANVDLHARVLTHDKTCRDIKDRLYVAVFIEVVDVQEGA